MLASLIRFGRVTARPARYQHVLVDKEDALRGQLDLIDSVTTQQHLTQRKVSHGGDRLAFNAAFFIPLALPMVHGAPPCH